jgi:hypothetical protein
MLWDKRHYTQGCFEDVVPLEQDKIALPKAVYPLNNPFLLFSSYFIPYICGKKIYVRLYIKVKRISKYKTKVHENKYTHKHST